jgi:hypothetical protein
LANAPLTYGISSLQDLLPANENKDGKEVALLFMNIKLDGVIKKARLT